MAVKQSPPPAPEPHGTGADIAALLRELVAHLRQNRTQLRALKSVKEIAGSTRLSSKTVSTYRTRLLQKLNLKTTADLIRYALEHGIGA